ncbi:lanosterol synthase [Saccharomycopsis crataegensis]|uniref:Terpene cyclase/mutase family member n=1 Tax=Saccharomycopsis crataegensis TaxID=43959 RepID=A0AAV5QHK8_9ASCO|nr:lanosterol synthase [Saccharomycopsis crataegensis]
MQCSDRLGFPKTDPARWRLYSDELGATQWKYLTSDKELDENPQSFYVKYILQNMTPEELDQLVRETNSNIDESRSQSFNTAVKGGRFLKKFQEPSGIFPMQYKGPMFMTIGYIVVNYISNNEIEDSTKIELIRYLVNTAHPVDGGWGLHEVDKSTCFGTSLGYISLRLLGVPADNPVCVKARKTLHSFGGAINNPHWGKAWLSVLNLFNWDGVNPAPAELWLTPYKYNPIHPGKWWVHTRAIYQPLSYLCAIKYQGPETKLIKEIRSEIFIKDFDSIQWSKHRNDVCGVDLYYPHTTVLDIANFAMVQYNKYIRPKWLVKYANKKVYELIKKEMFNTGGLCIAPVSYAFNACVVLIEEGADSELFKNMLRDFKDVLFHGPQGMTVMGTNGGQVWDASFVVQYFFMSGLAELDEFEDLIIRSFKFLLRSQFTTDCIDGSFRDKRTGAFPYSTKTQGYTVSDCTAEGIKALIMVSQHPKYAEKVKGLIDEQLLFKGIDVLLSLQNLGNFHYGSFATYEKIRATPLLEKINPAEVFGNIMVEYPYVECTDSAVLGLTFFTKYYDYRHEEIQFSISKAIDYICGAQNPDGSWYGCWGVCFTYAGMFALEALSTVKRSYNDDPVVRKGCDFFASRQMPSGGWGESMKSSETHTYVDSERPLVVQTAWALIGLILGKYPNKQIIDNGIKFLIAQQQPNGEWVSEGIEGVFNHSCAIEYPNYRFAFPIKALGLYDRMCKGTL